MERTPPQPGLIISLITSFLDALVERSETHDNLASRANQLLEVSPNNRAGCQDTVCKSNAAKCLKGTLRFGTWTEIQEHGGWRWKHWGCVSGQQLQNVQGACQKANGDYDFDAIDGYDEMG